MSTWESTRLFIPHITYVWDNKKVAWIWIIYCSNFRGGEPQQTPPHCSDTMMKFTKQRSKTKEKYICNFCFTSLFCQYHILCLDLRLLFPYPLVPHPPLISPSSLRLHVCIIFFSIFPTPVSLLPPLISPPVPSISPSTPPFPLFQPCVVSVHDNWHHLISNNSS